MERDQWSVPDPDLVARIEEWKRQYGRVYEMVTTVGDGEDGQREQVFVFRRPGRAELARFVKGALNDALKASTNLVYDCLLYPDRDVMERLEADEPGIIVGLGAELQKVAGTAKDFTVRRL